ncbi:MAG: 6-bladed beta-propeller [Bacteroidales bacterium]|jgi:hypothetical protein
MKNLIILYKIALLSVCIIVLASCSEKKSDKDIRIIDIAGAIGKGRIVDLSEIAKEIKYIPLETTDSSLLGDINSIFYENGHIYMCDYNARSIKVFDSTGKYVSKIDRYGRGPEEYTSMYDFHVIPKNGNVTIISSELGALNEYDMFGNFVSKTNFPYLKDYRNLRCIKMDDNTYLSAVFKMTETGEYSVIIYDSLSNIKMRIPNPEIKLNIKGVRSKDVCIVTVPWLYQFGSNIRIIYTDIPLDTIFSIGPGMKLEKLFGFNYGKFNKPAGKVTDIPKSSKIISFISTPFESEDYLLLRFDLRGLATEPFGRGNKNNTVAAIYNKNSGELTLMNQPVKGKFGFREDLENGPVFMPTTTSTNNEFLCTYAAGRFIDFVKNNNCSDKIRELAQKLNENDNPIIAIVKLK